MNVYLANSVFLSKVPKEHRSLNGNCQFTVLVRAKSKKRVAEILDTTYSNLDNFYGCHKASEQHLDIVKKDEVIYYDSDHRGAWIEYVK